MERISVVITGKCDVSCFGSYLINIFLKSRKAERERERERRYVKAGQLLFVCYCSRSRFTTMI